MYPKNSIDPIMPSFSLSKCLNYPGFIFLCPRKLSKHYPREKTKSLNYPNTIPENVVKKTNTWNYLRKKTNTLNYPNTIRYFGDLAKFSRILHENISFYNLCFFCKNLAMFNSVLYQSNRLTIARCKIK